MTKSTRAPAVRVRAKKARSDSSRRWLERQLNDPYVVEAKRQGWRSRAAFKLLELDDQVKLLKPGQRVVDLGAAPGGWTQVAVARTGADKGKGKETLRQVNIARDKGFDILMLMLRGGNVLKVSDEFDGEWMDHLTDMKRIREYRNEELVFTWTKMTGNDHMHHSLLYCLIASRMLGVASGSHVSLPLVSSFKVKPEAVLYKQN